MTVLRAVKRRARTAVAPAIFLSLVAYFSWQATQGNRGLRAHAQLQQQVQIYKAELARLEADRDALERRVSGLRDERLNLDTLDERSRAILNVADPGDVVVLYGPGQRLF